MQLCWSMSHCNRITGSSGSSSVSELLAMPTGSHLLWVEALLFVLWWSVLKSSGAVLSIVTWFVCCGSVKFNPSNWSHILWSDWSLSLCDFCNWVSASSSWRSFLNKAAFSRCFLERWWLANLANRRHCYSGSIYSCILLTSNLSMRNYPVKVYHTYALSVLKSLLQAGQKRSSSADSSLPAMSFILTYPWLHAHTARSPTHH